jgi:hypothetical protein
MTWQTVTPLADLEKEKKSPSGLDNSKQFHSHHFMWWKTDT